MNTPVKKPAGKAPAKIDYRVLADGWVAGQRAKKDDIISLTAAEARYEPVEPVAVGKATTVSGEAAQK